MPDVLISILDLSEHGIAAFLIVVAAGSGSRLAVRAEGLVPPDRPLLSWTLEALSAVPFAGTVIAAPPDAARRGSAGSPARGKVVAGGRRGPQSVRLAFEAGGVAGENVIVVHDAARPLS